MQRCVHARPSSKFLFINMKRKLKIITLNIERSKHLDLVLPFLQRQKPDVACLQEVMETDLEKIAASMDDAAYDFEPMGAWPEEAGIMGIAIFSKLPFTAARFFYRDKKEEYPAVLMKDPGTYNALNRVVLAADIPYAGSTFCVATTHFTWTPKGELSDEQVRDMRALLQQLQHIGEFVLCGDFNAPRGGEIYKMISATYRDNVPPQYRTSIDVSLHRDGHIRPEEFSDKMVDYIFSTPSYTVSAVEMLCGVSDHCAVVATIRKIQ